LYKIVIFFRLYQGYKVFSCSTPCACCQFSSNIVGKIFVCLSGFSYPFDTAKLRVFRIIFQIFSVNFSLKVEHFWHVALQCRQTTFLNVFWRKKSLFLQFRESLRIK